MPRPKEESIARPDLVSLLKGVCFLLSLAVPIGLLYLAEPDSFRFTWEGRALFVLFLWLVIVELALSYDRLPRTFGRRAILAISVSVLLPLLYVAGMYVLGLKRTVVELGMLLGVPYQEHGLHFLEERWPLSLEFLLFGAFLLLSTWLVYDGASLGRFMTALFFITATGLFQLMDTFYPFGTLAVLQMLVPFTASSVASALSLMGYGTSLSIDPVKGAILRVVGPERSFAIAIFWPSAGVHSMMIYTLVVLLFLRGTGMPTWRKAGYVAIGGAGTYLANVLRIVTVCLLGFNIGRRSAEMFHEYYGEIFFIAWVFAYLLLIATLERLIRRRGMRLDRGARQKTEGPC